MLIHPLAIIGAFLAVVSLAKLKNQATNPEEKEQLISDLYEAQTKLVALEEVSDPEKYEALKTERDTLVNQLAGFEAAEEAIKAREQLTAVKPTSE